MATFTAIWVGHYMDVLSNRLGWAAEESEEGDIRITLTDKTVLWLPNNADDPSYLHMTGLWSVPKYATASDLAQAAMEVNDQVKLVKVRPFDKGVRVSTEMVLAAPEALPEKRLVADVLPRAAGVIKFAVGKFLTAVDLHGIEGANDFAVDDARSERGGPND